MSDDKEPVVKPEATADANLSENELEQVVGGAGVVKGAHINKATITVSRAPESTTQE